VANAVVAHYLDGHLVKGSSLDVDPARAACHIRTPSRETIEVKLAELKALFFVRSLDGDPSRPRGASLDPTDPRARGAHKVELQFADGERLVGLTGRFPPVRPFFFVLPADGNGNNVRILVNRAAVLRIDPAEQAAGDSA
jgi:hypothetical protein